MHSLQSIPTFIDRTHTDPRAHRCTPAPHPLIDEDSLPTIYLNISYQTAITSAHSDAEAQSSTFKSTRERDRTAFKIVPKQSRAANVENIRDEP
jgi:hypothetical protein